MGAMVVWVTTTTPAWGLEDPMQVTVELPLQPGDIWRLQSHYIRCENQNWNLDWEEKNRLIQEIIFYNNFCLIIIRLFKGSPIPLPLDHGQKQVINELLHPTDNFAGEGSRLIQSCDWLTQITWPQSCTVIGQLIQSSSFPCCRLLFGKAHLRWFKRSNRSWTVWKIFKGGPKRTENLCNLKISSQSPKMKSIFDDQNSL